MQTRSSTVIMCAACDPGAVRTRPSARLALATEPTVAMKRFPSWGATKARDARLHEAFICEAAGHTLARGMLAQKAHRKPKGSVKPAGLLRPSAYERVLVVSDDTAMSALSRPLLEATYTKAHRRGKLFRDAVNTARGKLELQQHRARKLDGIFAAFVDDPSASTRLPAKVLHWMSSVRLQARSQ
jgi:hypothetical protein